MSNPPIIEMEASFAASERALETPLTRRLDSTLFWALCALVIFGPLAFGATEPWSLAILQSASIVLFALWCWRQIASRAVIIQPSPLLLPAALFAFAILLQFLLGATEYRQALVSQAMDYIITGKAPARAKYKLLKPGGYPEMIGAMFWTIDADRRGNYRFSNVVGPQLHGYPAPRTRLIR